ncbi:uracil-DNA glycosylase [Aerococcus urinaehominis]|uniref:Uracil-DNA glycosylase n=1 Tax=Aerococcus urinaehominis TaxID=128944 RepID=A0A0X8FJW7_9LACT|nr:uracil-DNA glycosylase family protein [Aerococcus urinaehominis]AMB98654.1 uracil-DNA glycosylase [Aerococcus urinaehominis]SDL97089.1 Uracil-DNA glycosylase [Aerococcus urinaehominis]
MAAPHAEKVAAIRQAIMADPANQSFTDRGIGPLFSAPAQARILVVGQAPGRLAEARGRFWDDPSGDRLRAWLGVSRDFFYQTDLIGHLPMDFYFPGKAKTGDQKPRSDFASKWHPALRALMPNLKLTILVGKHAQDFYLGDQAQANLTQTVAYYQDYLPDYFPLPHPSPLNNRWLKNNPWFLDQVQPDLAKYVAALIRDEQAE